MKKVVKGIIGLIVRTIEVIDGTLLFFLGLAFGYIGFNPNLEVLGKAYLGQGYHEALCFGLATVWIGTSILLFAQRPRNALLYLITGLLLSPSVLMFVSRLVTPLRQLEQGEFVPLAVIWLFGIFSSIFLIATLICFIRSYLFWQQSRKLRFKT